MEFFDYFSRNQHAKLYIKLLKHPMQLFVCHIIDESTYITYTASVFVYTLIKPDFEIVKRLAYLVYIIFLKNWVDSHKTLT